MEYYVYILAFHVIAMVSWMAVMFYLPRLYVYHVEHQEKKEFVEVVKIQEYKLYKYIGLPSFWATLASGSVMIYLNPYLLDSKWMQLKLVAVVLITLFSFSMEYYRVKLERGECRKSGQFFRAYNEVPTLLSLLIIAYVVTKESLPIYSCVVIAVFGLIIYKIATLKKEKR